MEVYPGRLGLRLLAAYDHDGTAAGNHKFFNAINVYEMAGGANGSVGGTSSSGTTLGDGSKSNTGTSAGNYQSLGSANGRTFSNMELDEVSTAGSGSSSGGGSNPDGGPLALTANMNRTLKYSSTHSSPLRNTLGFSSDWDQTRKHKTKDAVDSNGGTPVDLDDPLAPKYTVAVGDIGSISGTSISPFRRGDRDENGTCVQTDPTCINSNRPTKNNGKNH